MMTKLKIMPLTTLKQVFKLTIIKILILQNLGYLNRLSFQRHHQSCISSSVVTNKAFHGRVRNILSKNTLN